jgi:hypothetical protein
MDGLAEFIFIAVIIALTMAEGVGRRRKRAGKGPLGQTPTAGKPPGPTREAPPRTVRRAPPPQPASSGGVGSEDTSEGLIPADVWDEILGLARGEAKRPVPPSSTPEAAVETEERSVESLEPRREPQREPRREPRPEIPVLAGEDPGRVGSPRRVEPDVPAGRSRFAVAPAIQVTEEGRKTGEKENLRRKLFGGDSPQYLRKAIILKEVLGPPLALRE